MLVLDPASGRLHALSQSAALVYEFVDGRSSATDIAKSLGLGLNVPVDQLVSDVTDAVEVMIGERLLIADDPSSDAAGLPRLPVGATNESARSAPRYASAPTTDFGPKCVGAAVVRVRSGVPAVDALLRELLAILPAAVASESTEAIVSVTDPGDGGPYEIHDQSPTITSAVTAEEAAEAVLAACNRVATVAPQDAIRIHGGVVSSGRSAVVVCGVSGSGKSSLTAALVQAGWRYLTDEVAVIDPATRAVTPYPKWIDLSTASLHLLGLDGAAAIGPTGAKHHVPPSALGAVGERANIRAIVLLSDPADDSSLEMQELELSDAVPAMLGNVFATTWEHPHGLQAVVDLCAAATVVQMPRRPLDEMVALVETLID